MIRNTLLSLGAVLLALPAGLRATDERVHKPNVLIILADDKY